MRVLSSSVPPPRALDNRNTDLWMVASKIFEVETNLRTGSRVERVDIPCYLSHDDRLVGDLERLFLALFKTEVKVRLVDNLQKRLYDFTGDEVEERLENSHTCLFSLGLDSYSTITNAAQWYPEMIGAMVIHPDQPNVAGLLPKFVNGPFREAGIRVRPIRGPDHCRIMRGSRGVFYVMNAVALGRSNIIVGDVGPSMYPTPFTVLDEIFATASVDLLRLAEEITFDVLGERVRVIAPNENLTKAEVAAACKHSHFIARTLTCTSTQFANTGTPNCGTCYACVVRRLGTMVAGSIDKSYRYDLISLTTETLDNFVHLIRFSVDFLSDPDSVPAYTLCLPRRHNKLELFERFALDNITGLKLLNESGVCLPSPLEKLREISAHVVSNEMADERIARVREGRYQPVFEK